MDMHAHPDRPTGRQTHMHTCTHLYHTVPYQYLIYIYICIYIYIHLYLYIYRYV